MRNGTECLHCTLQDNKIKHPTLSHAATAKNITTTTITTTTIIIIIIIINISKITQTIPEQQTR
jgi:hypothetical protein